MSKTHWKKLMNPDYIGAYALPEGQDLLVTIKKVVREIVTSAGGKKEECTVCHLDGQKPLILNATNGKTIAKLYGPYIEDWAGKSIVLFASTTKFGGEIVECIRIKPQAIAAVKKPLSDERLAKAIESIKSGSFTSEKLFAQFDLTDEQAERVNKELEHDTDTPVIAQQANG